MTVLRRIVPARRGVRAGAGRLRARRDDLPPPRRQPRRQPPPLSRQPASPPPSSPRSTPPRRRALRTASPARWWASSTRSGARSCGPTAPPTRPARPSRPTCTTASPASRRRSPPTPCSGSSTRARSRSPTRSRATSRMSRTVTRSRCRTSWRCGAGPTTSSTTRRSSTGTRPNPTLPWTDDDTLAIMRAHAAEFTPPNQQTVYNNSNYVLLGYVIAQGTPGQPAPEYLTGVIRDLGLANTSYPSGDELPEPFLRGYLANGTTPPPPGGYRDIAARNPTVAGTAGAMVSTVPDMARYAVQLGTGAGLSPATAGQRQAGRRSRPPESGSSTGWASRSSATGSATTGRSSATATWSSTSRASRPPSSSRATPPTRTPYRPRRCGVRSSRPSTRIPCRRGPKRLTVSDVPCHGRVREWPSSLVRVEYRGRST